MRIEIAKKQKKVGKLKISKFVIGLSIGWLGVSGALANEMKNTPEYVPVADATKNGTRFVADISSTDGPSIDIPTGGFIDSIYLHVEWDRLIGQPTEFYGMKWTMGDRVDIPTTDGGIVRQFPLSQLDKYPDLKARFLDLRPVDLKLSFKFGLGFNDSMNGLVDMTDGLKEPHFYTVKNNADGTKIVSRVPHLIILGSAQQGNDFIPSSPPDWASLASWEYGLATKVGQNTNLAAQNTFEQATRMSLSNLKVESVDLPRSQMTAIYDEFQKREKAQRDKAQAEAEARHAEQIASSAEAKLAAKMKQIEAQKATDAKRQTELTVEQSAEAKLAAKMKAMQSTQTAAATPEDNVGSQPSAIEVERHRQSVLAERAAERRRAEAERERQRRLAQLKQLQEEERQARLADQQRSRQARSSSSGGNMGAWGDIARAARVFQGTMNAEIRKMESNAARTRARQARLNAEAAESRRRQASADRRQRMAELERQARAAQAAADRADRAARAAREQRARQQASINSQTRPSSQGGTARTNRQVSSVSTPRSQQTITSGSGNGYRSSFTWMENPYGACNAAANNVSLERDNHNRSSAVAAFKTGCTFAHRLKYSTASVPSKLQCSIRSAFRQDVATALSEKGLSEYSGYADQAWDLWRANQGCR
ncbi:MAG: hypothetical protein COA41_03660 [Sphingopyxis sp.]|nr:MAG: hypothetical protein COA41_03660 [Sphingopyxis sp.]